MNRERKERIHLLWREILQSESHEEIFHKDVEIFREVVKSTGRVFNMWVFNTIVQVGYHLWEAGTARGKWEFPDFYFETMGTFISCVLQGDAERAEQALDEHFTRIDKFTIRYAQSIMEVNL